MGQPVTESNIGLCAAAQRAAVMRALLVGQCGVHCAPERIFCTSASMTVAALRIGLPWLLRDGCPRCCRRPEAPGVSPGAGPTLR